MPQLMHGRKPTTLQLRLLRRLAVDSPASRESICLGAGISPTGGSFTRAVYGIKPGSSSGSPERGLLESGLIKPVEVEVEVGVTERLWAITERGRRVEEAWKDLELPEVRDAGKTTNLRYRKDS